MYFILASWGGFVLTYTIVFGCLLAVSFLSLECDISYVVSFLSLEGDMLVLLTVAQRGVLCAMQSKCKV